MAKESSSNLQELWHVLALHDQVADLYMPVNQPVQLKVIIIFSKRIDQRLRNLEGSILKTMTINSPDLEPAKEESKLYGEEEWVEEVQLSLGVPESEAHGLLVGLVPGWLDPLGSYEGGPEVRVDGQRDHLGVDQRDRHPVVVDDRRQVLPGLHQLSHHYSDSLGKL